MSDSKARIVVVGNGMVGHRFCERLVEQGIQQRHRVVVFGEEPWSAYDRVHLSEYFASRDPLELGLRSRDWYAQVGIELRTGTAIVSIDREAQVVVDDAGQAHGYDQLVLATGSSCFMPPVPGIDRPGVFPYRTIADLDRIIAYAEGRGRGTILGGGLLGLEAAKALKELGVDTTIVEMAPRLMPRQLDDAGARVLGRTIKDLGLALRLGARTTELAGRDAVQRLVFDDGTQLDTDMVVVSAGVRARDELAREAGLELGPRGGAAVDAHLQTSDPQIFAIGEVAAFHGELYGLVAPGYAMADVLAKRLAGTDATFERPDLSTKLKLLGVDVGSFGDAFAEGDDIDCITIEDLRNRIYKRINIRRSDSALVGGMLVGDVSQFAQLDHLARSRTPIPDSPERLIIGDPAAPAARLPDEAGVCSCEGVCAGTIRRTIQQQELDAVDGIKRCTKAGTGCGGCVPMLETILDEELAAAGKAVSRSLCQHFDHSRQDLVSIIKVEQLRSFDEIIERHGRGQGCEICKPAVASILASLWNELVVEHANIQDTNDRFLANIQRGGTYSVIPRVPGGELLPHQLVALGRIAQDYDLYTKITGGQRVALFGARVEDLPKIWEELIEHGFESGHAYGKALRTVKSCVGTDWCRYGIGDSCGLAIRVEKRYRGIRAPHKIKMAASGCIRECAEARSKDVGFIAVEGGWNVYVGGNGGAKPRHAELLAEGVDETTAIRYVDRFLMYYIHSADKLTRTAAWIESLEGGIDYVRSVVVDDALGIADRLERDMARLVDTYACEWKRVVEDETLRARFTHAATDRHGDPNVRFIRVRGQKRPAPWSEPAKAPRSKTRLPTFQPTRARWVRVGSAAEVPPDAGTTFRYGSFQIAVFNFASRGRFYATQNMCPHMQDMVLARGLTGDDNGVPKVICPMHKRRFSLESGQSLDGDLPGIRTFPIRVEAGQVFVKLPPADSHELTTPACGRKSSPR
ncbi:MAG: nitrite reductase large subunit NirB [Myxococcota bacterium]